MNLFTVSDTKLLFRYVQAVHHKGQVMQTPKGLIKMQAKLDSFIKVAAPNPKQTKRVSVINSEWTQNQTSAMQAHYNELLNTVQTNIRDRSFTEESFEQAWNGALKWTKQALGDKIAQRTIDTARVACRNAAMQGAPTKPKDSTSANVTKTTPSNPTNEEWTVVTGKRRQPKLNQKLTAVSGPSDPLSNFYETSFWFRGKHHRSVEHAYQMSKAHWLGNLRAFDEIARAPTALTAKKASDRWFKSAEFKEACRRNVYTRKRLEEWERQRANRVLHLLREKAKQCRPFMQALRDSGSNAIVHNVFDKYWGTGTRDVKVTNASNTFGRLLEQVRFELLGVRTDRGPAPGASPAINVERAAPAECRKQAPRPVAQQSPREENDKEKGTTPLVREPVPQETKHQWGSKDRRAQKKRTRETASQESASTGTRSPVQEAKRSRRKSDPTSAGLQNPGAHLNNKVGESALPNVATESTLDKPKHCMVQGRGVHSVSLSNISLPSVDKAEGVGNSMPIRSCLPASVGTSSRTGPSGEMVPMQEFGSTSERSEPPAESTSNHSETTPTSPLSSSLPNSPLPVESLTSSFPSSSPKFISSSQPSQTIVDYFGPKTSKIKFTCLKTNPSGETFVKSNVRRIEHNNNKKAWQLPPLTKSILIIGDSNLSKVKEIRQSALNSCQIISFPGAKYKDLYEILKQIDCPQGHVKHLVLSIGINNRAQNAFSTANKDIRNLIYQANDKFPKAKLYYPEIANKLANTKEMQNIKDFQKTWLSSPSISLLPSIKPIKTGADGIHWTWDSAKLLVDSWLTKISLN